MTTGTTTTLTVQAGKEHSDGAFRVIDPILLNPWTDLEIGGNSATTTRYLGWCVTNFVATIDSTSPPKDLLTLWAPVFGAATGTYIGSPDPAPITVSGSTPYTVDFYYGKFLNGNKVVLFDVDDVTGDGPGSVSAIRTLSLTFRATTDVRAQLQKAFYDLMLMQMRESDWVTGDSLVFVMDWVGANTGQITFPATVTRDTWGQPHATSNEPSSIAHRVRNTRWFSSPRSGREYPISEGERDGEKRGLWVGRNEADEVGRRDTRRNLRRERSDRLWPRI